MEDKMFHAIKFIRCIKNKKVAFPEFFWFIFKIIKNGYGRLFKNYETKLEGYDKPRNGTFHDLFKLQGLIFCIFRKEIESLKKSVGRKTLVLTNFYNVARSCNEI